MVVALFVVVMMFAALGALAKMFELCEALEDKVEGLREELESDKLREELERERERNRGLLEHVDHLDEVIALQDRKIVDWEGRSEGIRFCYSEINSEKAKLSSEKGKLKEQQEALARQEKLLGVLFLALGVRIPGGNGLFADA